MLYVYLYLFICICMTRIVGSSQDFSSLFTFPSSLLPFSSLLCKGKPKEGRERKKRKSNREQKRERRRERRLSESLLPFSFFLFFLPFYLCKQKMISNSELELVPNFVSNILFFLFSSDFQLAAKVRLDQLLRDRKSKTIQPN